MKPDDPTRDPNQGEGDRVSARRYDNHVREFIETDDVDEAAHDAAEWVTRAPHEAERAERAARRGPSRLSMHGMVDQGQRLLGYGQRLLARVRERYHRLVHR